MSARKGKKNNARLPFKVLDIRAALGITPGSKKRKVSGSEDESAPTKTPKTDSSFNNYTVVVLDQDEPDEMIVDVENMPIGPDVEPPSKRSQHFMQKYLRVSLKRLDFEQFSENCDEKSCGDENENIKDPSTFVNLNKNTKDSMHAEIIKPTNKIPSGFKPKDTDDSMGGSEIQALQGTESNSSTIEVQKRIKDLLEAPIRDSSVNELQNDLDENTANDADGNHDVTQGTDERTDAPTEKQQVNAENNITMNKVTKESSDRSFNDTSVEEADCVTVDEDSDRDSSNKTSPNTDKSTPQTGSEKKRKRRSKEEIEKIAQVKAARKAEKQRLRDAVKQRKEEERQKLKEQKEQERAKKIAEKEKEREEKKQREEKEKEDKEKAKKEKEQQREEERLEKLRAKEQQKLMKQLVLEAKLEEKKRKDDEKLQKLEEKRKLDEELEKKKQKARDAFVKFFVKPQQQHQSSNEEDKSDPGCGTFKPFEIRKDMTVAPTVPLTKIANFRKEIFEDTLKNQKLDALYLEELRSGFIKPFEFKKVSKVTQTDSDIIVVVPGESQNMQSKMRPKLLQFHCNVRPPYWGTWSKSSGKVGPRKPFGKDETLFDYEIDSDDEWEEEEPGESLSGTEDEKEPEDDYDIDNEFMVPHGYLSPEEEQDQEQEPESPEALKLRLKMKEQEFKAELSKKCPVLQPFIVGCVWMETSKDSEVMEQFKMVALGVVPIPTKYSLPPTQNEEGSPKASSIQASGNETSGTGMKGSNRKYEVPEEAMPHLLRLVHANTNGKLYLIREFKKYWSLQSTNEDSDTKENLASDEQGKDLQSLVQQTPVPKSTMISKRQLERMLQKIATWLRCPDPAVNKFCWWVHESVREKYGLLDLPVPNQWQYITEKDCEMPESHQQAVSGTPSIKMFAQTVTPPKNKNTDFHSSPCQLGAPNDGMENRNVKEN